MQSKNPLQFCHGMAASLAAEQVAPAGWTARSDKFIWALGTLYHPFTG